MPMDDKTYLGEDGNFKTCIYHTHKFIHVYTCIRAWCIYIHTYIDRYSRIKVRTEITIGNGSEQLP